MALFLLAAWGTGRLVERYTLGENLSGWGFPAALGMAAWLAGGGLFNVLQVLYAPAFIGLLAVGAVLRWWNCGAFADRVVIGLFSGSALERLERVRDSRHLLSFPVTSRLVDTLSWAFSAPARKRMRAIQHKVPEGTGILTWIDLAIHLDFARNPVVTVTPLGLWNPMRAGLPRTDDPAGLRRILLQAGLEYVLWVPSMGSEQTRQYLQRQLDHGLVQYQRWAERALALDASLQGVPRLPGVTVTRYGERLIIHLNDAAAGAP